MLGRKRAFRLVAGASIAALILAGAPLRAQGLAEVNLVQTTRSAQDWPLQVALREGFFTANGIRLEFSLAGASAAVAQQLTAGAADIGSVSTTQVVEAVLGGAPIVQVMKNVMTTPYTVIGRKGITSIEQLRGKTIMIGGPQDITRVFMDKLLSAHGLHAGDYTYTFAGAPAARYAALLSGGIDATPVLPPVTFQAMQAGFPVLDQTQKYFPHFATSGYTARTAWATAHPELMTAFIKSFLQGVRWIYDPRNKAQAIAILAESTNIAPSEAERTYDLYTSTKLFSTNGRYDPRDFAEVVDMLVTTGQIHAPAPPPTRFYDDTWADAAAKQLR